MASCLFIFGMAPQLPWKEFFITYTKTSPFKHPNLDQSEYVYWLSRVWWWEVDLQEIDWSLSSEEIGKQYPMLEGMSPREEVEKYVPDAPPEELSSEGLMAGMVRLEAEATKLSKELSIEEKERKDVEYQRDTALRRLSDLRGKYEEATAPPVINPDEVAKDYAEYLESVSRIGKTYRLPFIDLRFLHDHWGEVSAGEKERLKMIQQAIPKQVLADLFQERYTLWIYEQIVGPWIPPVKWTSELESRLRDRFYATLNKQGVRVTTPMRARFRDELEGFRELPSEKEMMDAAEELGYIIAREVAAAAKIRKAIKPPPKKRPPRRVFYRPPVEEEEFKPFAIERVPREPVEYARVPSPLVPVERISPAAVAARKRAAEAEIRKWGAMGLSPEYISRELGEDLETVRKLLE